MCTNAARSAAALLVCLFITSGCARHEANPEPVPPQVTFTDFGLKLDFAQPTSPKRLLVRNADGALAQEISLAGQRHSFEVPFTWEPTENYTFELQLPARELTTSATAPAKKFA